MIIAFTALACSTEVDDADQKKRGVVKGNTLNTIPTGAQKQDYTYSIYSQNPSSQAGSSPSYQSQVPNSFYPNQASQYYTSSNAPTDPSPQYAQQSQINLLPPSSSQFVPINFAPNPGYQSKYQLVPTQPKGNIQLAILQQPNSYPSPSVYPSPYPQNLFSPNPTNPIGPHQNFLSSLPSGQFNVPQSLPYSLGNSYLGQPSAMVVLAQPNPFNNYMYNNPSQSLYNYFPSHNQPRYGLSYAPQGSPDVQVSAVQNIPKEENEITGANTSEYVSAPSDSSAGYKSGYTSSRSSYLKL